MSRAMTEVDNIQTSECITKQFIIKNVPSVKTVEVLTQSLGLANQEEPTLSIHNDHFLKSSESSFMEIQIEGDTIDDHFEESVVAALEDIVVTALEDIKGYQDALFQKLEMFVGVKDPKPREVVEHEP